MTPEQRAWQAAFREMGGLWLVQRIEDRYSPDIPDAHFSYDGVTGWIEMKAGVHNKPLKLRPGQLNWLTKWSKVEPCYLIWRVLHDTGYHMHWGGLKCVCSTTPHPKVHGASPDALRGVEGYCEKKGFRDLLDTLKLY